MISKEFARKYFRILINDPASKQKIIPMPPKKILIYSPPYNDRSGGIIVSHKLCHLLNEIGREAYLCPYIVAPDLDGMSKAKAFKKKLKYWYKSNIKAYKKNPAFNTPVLKPSKNINWDEFIVIYPEITDGNPLGAKHIVRWLLHQPGFHTGRVEYGPGELYFKFNSGINDFAWEGSTLANAELKVIHYPTELYNQQSCAKQRSGVAYSLRKMKDKKIVHDPENAILIDNLSHKEVAEVFKRCKRFISYDSYTAYSIFAALCGCESIVIPEEGVCEEAWYPDPQDRYGIAYGFDRLEHARETAHLVKTCIDNENRLCTERVQIALQEMDTFFA